MATRSSHSWQLEDGRRLSAALSAALHRQAWGWDDASIVLHVRPWGEVCGRRAASDARVVEAALGHAQPQRRLPALKARLRVSACATSADWRVDHVSYI